MNPWNILDGSCFKITLFFTNPRLKWNCFSTSEADHELLKLSRQNHASRSSLSLQTHDWNCFSTSEADHKPLKHPRPFLLQDHNSLHKTTSKVKLVQQIPSWQRTSETSTKLCLKIINFFTSPRVKWNWFGTYYQGTFCTIVKTTVGRSAIIW